jgi:hypothetical protein
VMERTSSMGSRQWQDGGAGLAIGMRFNPKFRACAVHVEILQRKCKPSESARWV